MEAVGVVALIIVGIVGMILAVWFFVEFFDAVRLIKEHDEWMDELDTKLNSTHHYLGLEFKKGYIIDTIEGEK